MAEKSSLAALAGCHIVVTDEVIAFAIEAQKAILGRAKTKSLRAVAREIGIHPATVHAVAAGNFDHVSWEKMDLVRRALGLPGIGVLILTTPEGARRT